jgi:hypothetical protein
VEIFTAQGAPLVSLTPVENLKKFNQRGFKYFVWTPLGSTVKIYIHFFFKFTLRCKQSDMVPIKIIVSLTPVANFFSGFVNTGDKFAMVSLILVVHLDLGFSEK